MVTTKLNLSMTEPQVRQIYAKQGDTGRVLDISLDQTPEDGTLRILRPDGVEVTSEAVTGGEISESGETVTFESMTEADVTELTVGIEPVQDLSHGDPSPSNICPITGHDEVTVTRTGKNLVNVNSSGITGAYIDVNGEIHSSNAWSVSDFVPVLSGENYVLSGLTSHPNTGVDNFIFYDGNRNKVGKTTQNALTLFAIPSGVAYVKFSWKNTEKDTVMFEQGSTATAYEPYQGSTYTTSLGQTVYGGTLDMVTGGLTVDRAMVDLGTLTWERTTTSVGTYRFYTGGLGSVIKKPTTMTEISDLVCSQYVATYGNAPSASVQGICIHTNGNLMVYDSTLDTASATDFKTAMNGVTCVYPLATPLTYTLTAQQIKTLVGTNNVWASSGDIVNIKFTYGGLLSELPSDATSVVGKCYCDVEQNGVSSMPFTLNVKKNERQ